MKVREFFGNLGATLLSLIFHAGLLALLLWQTVFFKTELQTPAPSASEKPNIKVDMLFPSFLHHVPWDKPVTS